MTRLVREPAARQNRKFVNGHQPAQGLPAEGMQRDMKVEGLFGNRGILIEDTDEIVQLLDDRAVEALSLIDEVLGRQNETHR